MKDTFYKFGIGLSPLLLSVLITGCNISDVIGNPETEILLSATSVETTTTIETKAPTTFPNDGKVYLIADKSPADWSNLHYDNIEITTTDISPSNGYNFSFATTQYWPLNGDEIAFLAYSPMVSPCVLPNNDKKNELDLLLHSDNSQTPDLIYAQGVKYGDKRVGKRHLNLGEFLHAYSQLTVKLVISGIEHIQGPVKLTSLELMTKSKAKFDLLTSQMTISPTGSTLYSLASNITLANNTDYQYDAATNKPFLLFPNDNASIKIRLNIGDINRVYSNDISVGSFITSDNKPAKLERGKHLTLTITITLSETIDATYTGKVENWRDKGEYGAAI